MKELLGGLGLRFALLAAICAVGVTSAGIAGTKHPLTAHNIGFSPGDCTASRDTLLCVSPAIFSGCNLGSPDCRTEHAALDHRLSDRPSITLAKLDQRIVRHRMTGGDNEGVSYTPPRRPD